MNTDAVTIASLAGTTGLRATVHAQITTVTTKTTRDAKPFLELQLADATDQFTLRVWSDHPDFQDLKSTPAGGFFELTGDFITTPFGLDAKNWSLRSLSKDETANLLAGPTELQEKQSTDLTHIRERCTALTDPRLKSICELFFEKFLTRLQRTAAARAYHHARRGGLVEHVAQMMRAADAIADVYPALNRDLLITGVLFHDSGKLWENCHEEDGFQMPYSKTGELMGHILVGTELVNHLFHEVLGTPEAEAWKTFNPSSDEVRLHLLHLIGSHHGTMEFGSPVVPKTPEAAALHYVDNLDAKLEMIFSAIATAPRINTQIIERVRPLSSNLVMPLPRFEPAPTGPDVEKNDPE